MSETILKKILALLPDLTQGELMRVADACMDTVHDMDEILRPPAGTVADDFDDDDEF